MQGFTLLEVLIAMGITTLLLGSMYSVYTYSQRAYRVQEQTAEAQENARAAIQLMSRDIIMAGYSSTPGIIVANKASLTVRSYGADISYSLYSGNRIGRTAGVTRQAVAEGIRRLSFKYKDGSGTTMDPDVPIGSLVAVRLITISVTAGTPTFKGYSGSCTLETTLSPRNLW
jgi:type IV pilus assembly protein PilW